MRDQYDYSAKWKRANRGKTIANKTNMVECQNGIRVEQCGFSAMGQRCTLPGTVTSIVGGEWFCRHHYGQVCLSNYIV